MNLSTFESHLKNHLEKNRTNAQERLLTNPSKSYLMNFSQCVLSPYYPFVEARGEHPAE